MKQHASHSFARRASGLSLVETVLVIAILGVITALSIPSYTNLTENSKRVTSVDFVESLNRALRSFSQANWEITTLPVANSVEDEQKVLRSIQYKWPAAQMRPGSPYFSTKYNPPSSSDSKEYRFVWNGRTFQVLEPGINGTGLLLKTSFTDTPYTYPANYKPEGMP